MVSMELTVWFHLEIHRLNQEIKALAMTHEDFRGINVVRNEELGLAAVIEFHHP